jgi:hypothetical protein
MPIKDITGVKYYSLTAIRISEESKLPRRGYKWVWRCDCGKEIIAYPTAVRAADNQSCGCQARKINKGNKLSDGEATINDLIKVYKYHAKQRDYAFELDKDDVKYITKQDCHYCGKPPSNLHRNRWSSSYVYNGIDRIDNSKGYYIDNVVPCCIECNYSKNDRGYFQFIDWIHKISTRFIAAGVS